ncbi:hypothetical protein Bca52824_048447 [Brassica carinata]|uniref:Uncharacterized protein n=1 Tax=Brassica carinata TaxID=52824 RepID=A0A8X7RKZ2_BRACI|nr:hypothetical protein Bca52824_048447 [Brassica carinata]
MLLPGQDKPIQFYCQSSVIHNLSHHLPLPDFVSDEGDDDNGVLSKFKVGGTNREVSSASKVVKKAWKK